MQEIPKGKDSKFSSHTVFSQYSVNLIFGPYSASKSVKSISMPRMEDAPSIQVLWRLDK